MTVRLFPCGSGDCACVPCTRVIKIYHIVCNGEVVQLNALWLLDPLPDAPVETNPWIVYRYRLNGDPTWQYTSAAMSVLTTDKKFCIDGSSVPGRRFYFSPPAEHEDAIPIAYTSSRGYWTVNGSPMCSQGQAGEMGQESLAVERLDGPMDTYVACWQPLTVVKHAFICGSPPNTALYVFQSQGLPLAGVKVTYTDGTTQNASSISAGSTLCVWQSPTLGECTPTAYTAPARHLTTEKTIQTVQAAFAPAGSTQWTQSAPFTTRPCYLDIQNGPPAAPAVAEQSGGCTLPPQSAIPTSPWRAASVPCTWIRSVQAVHTFMAPPNDCDWEHWSSRSGNSCTHTITSWTSTNASTPIRWIGYRQFGIPVEATVTGPFGISASFSGTIGTGACGDLTPNIVVVVTFPQLPQGVYCHQNATPYDLSVSIPVALPCSDGRKFRIECYLHASEGPVPVANQCDSCSGCAVSCGRSVTISVVALRLWVEAS